jgi:flagella basal body P-ring formation protein FlgA
MTMNLALLPIGAPRAGRIRPMMVVRVAIAAVAVCLAVAPAFSAERAVLRGEVTASADVLTLTDLVEGADGAAASTPLFRAPALGETGTIQAARVVEAAAALGVAVDPAGKGQVLVSRAARRIALPEIEAAIKSALELRHGVDARALSIRFDGAPPKLIVAPDLTTPVIAENVAYDRRSRRVAAQIWIGPNPNDRRAEARVTGAVVELVEVAVLTRAIARGEPVQASDFAIERRARETIPADAQADALGLGARVARRALAAGGVLRAGDLAKPEIVARGEVVTVVYEVPGLLLTLRARASEAGALGDSIAVVNPQSKKSLQATVVGPGKVAVGALPIGRIAAATP